MKRSGRLSTVAALCVAASFVPISAAYAAEESPTPDDVAVVVSDAAASVGAPAATTSNELEVVASGRASEGIDVISDNTALLTIPLPDGLSLADGVVTDSGSTVYSADEGSVDVMVEEVAQGVRVSTVLRDGSQETFSYALPENISATPQPDGSLELTRTEVVESEGATVEVTATIGSIEPAWAVDANGAEVITAYEVRDGVITQSVDTTDAAFPVVADPTWSLTSPIQVRIRFNRAETATIAGGGWIASGASAACTAAGAFVAGPGGAIAFGAGCFLSTGAMVYTAGVAQNSSPKRCLEQFMTFVPLSGVIIGVPWYGTYACK